MERDPRKPSRRSQAVEPLPQAICQCLRLRLTHEAPWFAPRSMSCLGGLVRRRRPGAGIGIGDDIVNSIFDRF